MKNNANIQTFEFDDMTIIVITVQFVKMTSVYVKVEENLEYVFGVESKDADKLDIEALHENGYFDDWKYKDKASRFMKGEVINE